MTIIAGTIAITERLTGKEIAEVMTPERARSALDEIRTKLRGVA